MHGVGARPRRAGLLLWAAACAAFTPVAAGEAGAPGPAANGGYLSSFLVSPKPAHACDAGGGPFYRAAVIVTGTDMRQRPWGFARTLGEVLVKVSGDPRLADDPRVLRLAATADRFVACFDYADLMAGVPLHDDQGTYDRPHRLTVYFDPAKIDALLAQLGDRPWVGARPVIVPIVLVHGRKPPPYVLSAEIPAGVEQRGSFAVAADHFGATLRLPSDAELRRWGADTERLPASPPLPRVGEAVVMGTLDWSEALPGWVANWRMRWRGADYTWSIAGVNYDAAFRNLVRGVVLIASRAAPPDHGS